MKRLGNRQWLAVICLVAMLCATTPALAASSVVDPEGRPAETSLVIGGGAPAWVSLAEALAGQQYFLASFIFTGRTDIRLGDIRFPSSEDPGMDASDGPMPTPPGMSFPDPGSPFPGGPGQYADD